ncbi:lanthionine synthetase C family protein [Streptomyces sp. NPDC031705]|uniref:lanthionine synthetase C family protein n=1 Tax=Streptomyces sp. NPDC031705 TaxID=3155729 RepID=UPI0034032642
MTEGELGLTSLVAASQSPWRSVLNGQQRDAALSVAREVAARTSAGERIAAALSMAGQQTRYPEVTRWLPYSLASGDVGIAVLCSYVDQCQPGDGWDSAGHDFLAAGILAAEEIGLRDSGLYGGLSGLEFAATSLSRHGTRYRRLLDVLDAELAPHLLAGAENLRGTQGSMPVETFDLVSGASGVAAQLLVRDRHQQLPALLDGLVRLSLPMDGGPGWRTPPELMHEGMRQTFPTGNLNCGLAHGIPGPLAVLSLALRAGYEQPGQVDAVQALVGWLLEHRSDDEWGINWPCAIPWPDDPRSLPHGWPPPARSAWCYGSPGVARALWLAGDALDDDGLKGFAVEALAAVMRRPLDARSINSPTFCHGVAGLLQVVLRFAHDTHLRFLTEAAELLVSQLLAAFDPRRPLGYAALEPGDNPVDRAGLLDGAAGVAMVLLAAATDTEPTWDRLFLLS